MQARPRGAPRIMAILAAVPKGKAPAFHRFPATMRGSTCSARRTGRAASPPLPGGGDKDKSMRHTHTHGLSSRPQHPVAKSAHLYCHAPPRPQRHRETDSERERVNNQVFLLLMTWTGRAGQGKERHHMSANTRDSSSESEGACVVRGS